MRNFTPAHFNEVAAYIPPVDTAQYFTFPVSLSRPLRSRNQTGVVADRVFISLHQLGVALQGVRISKTKAEITIVVPLDVTIGSVIQTVTERVNSVLQALV
jgi:hypothetical protein